MIQRTGPGNLLLLVFLILTVADLSADQKVAVTIGVFTENQINNAPYAARNLVLVPGLSASIRGIEVPVYGRLQFENRMNTGNMSNSSYLDTELRYKAHVGGTLELIPGYTFNPEYEARIKSYVGYSIGDYVTWENRFHQNLFLPLTPSVGLVLKAMPTWVIANSESDNRGAGTSIYMDFYFEGSLGPVWNISDRNTLSFFVYSEMMFYETFETSPGTQNNGLPYRMLEFQARFVWSYSFRNGITISPFARVGIIRNVYSQSDGNVDLRDQRRDRFGFTLRDSTAASGMSLYMESYYQRQEQNGETPLHRFMFKIGCDYSFLPSS